MSEEIPLSEICAAYFGKRGEERIGDRTRLVIERCASSSLLVPAVFGLGMLAELADALAETRADLRWRSLGRFSGIAGVP